MLVRVKAVKMEEPGVALKQLLRKELVEELGEGRETFWEEDSLVYIFTGLKR